MKVESISRRMSRDQDIKRKQKTLYKNINIFEDPSTGILNFDLSYLRKNRGFIPGPYLNGTQGDHTVCFSIIITSLERRISGKTLSQVIPYIVSHPNRVAAASLHKDILILFHLYSKVLGKGGDFYLRDRLTRLHHSRNAIFTGLYKLDLDSNQELQFNDEQREHFLHLLTNYLLDYVYLMQTLPFSTAVANPGEGSGYRGEGHAKNFIEKLDRFSQNVEKECIEKFSKLFDQKAIQNTIKEFAQHQYRAMSFQLSAEIVAFQLIPFLGILEAYPVVKEFFFGIIPSEDFLRVSQAKYPNLSHVLFGPGDHAKYFSLIERSLQLIAKLRSSPWMFNFLK